MKPPKWLISLVAAASFALSACDTVEKSQLSKQKSVVVSSVSGKENTLTEIHNKLEKTQTQLTAILDPGFVKRQGYQYVINWLYDMVKENNTVLLSLESGNVLRITKTDVEELKKAIKDLNEKITFAAKELKNPDPNYVNWSK